MTESSAPARFGWPLVAGLVLLTALGLRAWVFGLLRVSTGSMEPTVHAGEVVLWTPIGPARPGDVVVVELPSEPGVLHVKRLVALGPTELELSDGRLYLDGVAAWSEAPDRSWTDGACQVRESRFVEERSAWARWQAQRGGDQELVRLSRGQAWLLGDDRRSSEDSRQWGAVPTSALRGRVLFVAWPLALCDSASSGPRSVAPVDHLEE